MTCRFHLKSLPRSIGLCRNTATEEVEISCQWGGRTPKYKVTKKEGDDERECKGFKLGVKGSNLIMAWPWKKAGSWWVQPIIVPWTSWAKKTSMELTRRQKCCLLQQQSVFLAFPRFLGFVKTKRLWTVQFWGGNKNHGIFTYSGFQSIKPFILRLYFGLK